MGADNNFDYGDVLIESLGYSIKNLEDVELATLKIHIVIEELLIFLLSVRLGVAELTLRNKIKTDMGSISFYYLLEIALTGTKNQHLLGSLRKLNNARNSISHTLDKTEVLEKLEGFVGLVADNLKAPNTPKPFWSTETIGQLDALQTAFNIAAWHIIALAHPELLKVVEKEKKGNVD